jgi:hypothetical protein
MEFLFDYGKDKSTLKFNKESGSFAREVWGSISRIVVWREFCFVQ